jgi:hypothetical protein
MVGLRGFNETAKADAAALHLELYDSVVTR